MYFKAHGYFPVSLDKGRYNITLKYKIKNKGFDDTKCFKYRPETDWQNISLDTINLN
jgi:hypothetical protein